MKKNMKTIIISLIVLVIALGGIFLYKSLKEGKTTTGNKNIEVTVISAKNNYEKTHKHTTNAKILGEALDEMGIIKADTSKATRFLTGVDGINADGDGQEWWNLKVNGTDSQTGIDDTSIKDGDKVVLTLTTGW